MKNILVSFFILTAIPYSPRYETDPNKKLPVAGNLVIITIDGFRWQEVFTGADSLLISDESCTPDTSTIKMLYWAGNAAERRKRLMPFFWNILAARGQLYGNREFDNKVNTENSYAISYPGYNEIFTGTPDANISSNRKNRNPHINILEYLDQQPQFRGRVAAFTSWDVFPYIFNADRNNVMINSGYMTMGGSISAEQELISKVQQQAICEKTGTRHDQLTFLTAKEYIRQHQPKIMYIGLGETDEFAHQRRYDLYLEQANKTDKMIAELWHWVQTTPGYKNNTTFIITTDHGRGSRVAKWSSHGEFIKGSSQTWLAIMGPGINPVGEVKDDLQFYQSQLAQTIAGIVGEKFSVEAAAPSISLR